MSKRGQITLFAILGILLLLVVVVILSLQKVTVQDRLDKEAQSAVDEFVQANALNHYVSSCLDKVASEGISLLGRQGGVIYESQGGLTVDETHGSQGIFFEVGFQYYPYNYTTWENGQLKTYSMNISYGVRPFIDCPAFSPPVPINLSDETTSYYPVEKTFFQDYVSRYSNYYFASSNPGCALLSRKISWSGFLGLNNLPTICAYDGNNVDTGVCNVLYGFDSPLEENSLERQLTTYIETKLPVCVNFSIYENILESNITIVDDPNVSIYFQQPRGVLIQAKYPFLVSVEGKEPILKQVNFQKNMPINLNGLYSYSYSLVKNMLRDPYFSLEDDWNDSIKNPLYKPFYELQVLPSDIPCEDNNFVCMDNLMVIMDTSSLVSGKALYFQFALRQRKPVLDYLHDSSQHAFINDELVDYQFQVNDTISLPIHAIDPDGGDVSIEFIGWKQTIDNFLNETCCSQKFTDGCNLSNHWQCIDEKLLAEDSIRWNESLIFLTPSTQAQYKTSTPDLGIHNVTIVAKDDHGLQDFQIVRILVFDLPKAVLHMHNNFSDISNSFASVEDKYFLDASGSIASLLGNGGLSSYTFMDRTEEVTHSLLDGTSILYVPFVSTTINNISTPWFSRDYLASENRNEHIISLVVKEGDILTSTPDIQSVSVSECLPHGYRGYSTPYLSFSRAMFISDPYPFYTGSNPYQASHVCCEPFDWFSSADLPNQLEGGKHAHNYVRCYEKLFTTTYPYADYSLLQKAVIDGSDGISHPVTPETYGGAPIFRAHVWGGIPFVRSPEEIDFNDDSLNNIFTVNYTQSCSGYRGNTCGGEIKTEWTEIECGDFNPSVTTQFARCKGPNIVNFNEEDNGLFCQDYTDTSYELKLFNVEQGISSALESFYENKYGADTFNDLLVGYCAGPEEGVLNTNADIVITASGGDFTCMATCDSGVCGYTEPEHCECDNSNICDGILASTFVINAGNLRSFRCTNGFACLNDCTVAPSTSVAACTCRGGVFIDNQCCETGGATVFTNGDGTIGCFTGIVFTQNQLLQTPVGSTLFCQGDFLVCGEAPGNYPVQEIMPNLTSSYCGYQCLPATTQWYLLS